MIDMFEDDHSAAMHFLSTVSAALMAAWERNAESGVLSVGTPSTAPLDASNDDDDDDEPRELPAQPSP